MNGPIILIANLLTEGRGMAGFTAADAVARIEEAIERPVDVVITNMKWPSPQVLERYALEHKEPLAPGNAAGALRAGRRRVLDAARSRATIACGSRTRCGACCRERLLSDESRQDERGSRPQSVTRAILRLVALACSASSSVVSCATLFLRVLRRLRGLRRACRRRSCGVAARAGFQLRARAR